MENNSDIFTCPITQQLFDKPVLACDGHFYEKSAIKEWLRKHDTSPLTNLPMKKHLVTSHVFKNQLDNFYQNNPIELENKYCIISLDKNHFHYYKKIELQINNCEFKKILKYENFNIVFFKKKTLQILFQQADFNILKYFIDNLVDLECIDNSGWQPIHYACKFSKPEIIKYIVEKGVDLESVIEFNIRPIHLVCKYSTPEIIRYFVEKGVNLECETVSGFRAIHLVCKHSTPEMIRYFIDQGLNSKGCYHYIDDRDFSIDDRCNINHLLCKNTCCILF